MVRGVCEKAIDAPIQEGVEVCGLVLVGTHVLVCCSGGWVSRMFGESYVLLIKY